MPVYKLSEGSVHEQFFQSRSKIRIFGGGFANGKTTSVCILVLELSKLYPGSNGLIARSTYPKLNDTIRKEFIKWCPENWIKSFPRSANASNTCTLKNGTTINFRYIAQQGKTANNDATTSNLLSATYDWIIVDQCEDPEIVHKDFLDLLGRLRGSAKLDPSVIGKPTLLGDSRTLPLSGPRWLILTTNPTRNWVYRELVKPYHDYLKGIYNPNLLCDVDSDDRPILVDGHPVPMIEVFEGSTYINAENLAADFIKTLESAYRGQQRDRYLLGKWAAYEGLVYPTFDEEMHVVKHAEMVAYMREIQQTSSQVIYVEGYDDGLAVPCCYLGGFVDHNGNVCIVDGFYQPELLPGVITSQIKTIRQEYGIDASNYLIADPDIFRRKRGNSATVGSSVADMFFADGIYCERGNNDIHNGIVKVSQYLHPMLFHRNPFTGEVNAPHVYFSDKLSFVFNEITDYYWKRDSKGEVEDEPQDKNDHAMDTIKYILSKRPEISKLAVVRKATEIGHRKWGERDMPTERRSVRHG